MFTYVIERRLQGKDQQKDDDDTRCWMTCDLMGSSSYKEMKWKVEKLWETKHSLCILCIKMSSLLVVAHFDVLECKALSNSTSIHAASTLAVVTYP